MTRHFVEPNERECKTVLFILSYFFYTARDFHLFYHFRNNRFVDISVAISGHQSFCPLLLFPVLPRSSYAAVMAYLITSFESLEAVVGFAVISVSH